MTAKNISRNYFDFSNLFVHILFQSTIFDSHRCNRWHPSVLSHNF